MKTANHDTYIRKSCYRKEYRRTKHYACDRAGNIATKISIEETDNINRELKKNLKLLSTMINNAKLLLLTRSRKKDENSAKTTKDAIELVIRTDRFKTNFPECAKNLKCVELVSNMYTYAILPDKKEEEENIYE